MNIGIANEETWEFLRDFHKDLSKHHQVHVFTRPKTNWPIFRERRQRAVFQKDLRHFLTHNDVVFFEWASELLAAATQLPKTCGIVTRLHRYEMYQWVDHVNWDKVDKIVLVSKAKQDEFLAKFPGEAAKTKVINVAVALDRFTHQPRPYTGSIGTLCHITPRKRVYELILDFYELLQQTPKRPDGQPAYHLHIGGDIHPSHADYYQAMLDVVKKLDLADSVTFHGKVTEAWNWYHNIDIFISNSYSEGLQVATMEAMASGCYTLSHHWAGAEEMLPDENLYLSGEQLRAKIKAFDALNEEEQLALKARMRLMAQAQFNMEENNLSLRQLLEQVGKIHSV